MRLCFTRMVAVNFTSERLLQFYSQRPSLGLCNNMMLYQHLIQQAIKSGKTIMYLDVEFTPEYTKERMEKLICSSSGSNLEKAKRNR
jgi:hypothetical protein